MNTGISIDYIYSHLLFDMDFRDLINELEDGNIYESPPEWGETYYGTMEDWTEEIWLKEEGAKKTIYYTWFEESDFDKWNDYVEYLMDSLIQLEIQVHSKGNRS